MGSGPAGSVFGEISFYQKTWGTCRGSCHLAKRISDTLAALRHWGAMQNSGTGPCVDCRRVLWVPGPRGQYSGKFRFIKKLRVQGEGFATCINVVLTVRSSGTPWERQAKFIDIRCGDCRSILWVPGPRGQYSG